MESKFLLTKLSCLFVFFSNVMPLIDCKMFEFQIVCGLFLNVCSNWHFVEIYSVLCSKFFKSIVIISTLNFIFIGENVFSLIHCI